MEAHRVEHIFVRWVGAVLVLLGMVVLALTPVTPGFMTLRLAAPLFAIGLLLYLRDPWREAGPVTVHGGED